MGTDSAAGSLLFQDFLEMIVHLLSWSTTLVPGKKCPVCRIWLSVSGDVWWCWTFPNSNSDLKITLKHHRTLVKIRLRSLVWTKIVWIFWVVKITHWRSIWESPRVHLRDARLSRFQVAITLLTVYLVDNDNFTPSLSIRHTSCNQTRQWKNPLKMVVLLGKSSINGGFPVAMFDYRKVSRCESKISELSPAATAPSGAQVWASPPSAPPLRWRGAGDARRPRYGCWGLSRASASWGPSISKTKLEKKENCGFGWVGKRRTTKKRDETLFSTVFTKHTKSRPVLFTIFPPHIGRHRQESVKLMAERPPEIGGCCLLKLAMFQCLKLDGLE